MAIVTTTWFEDLVSQVEYQTVQNFKLNNDCWQHSAFSVVPYSSKAVIWGDCKFTYPAFPAQALFFPSQHKLVLFHIWYSFMSSVCSSEKATYHTSPAKSLQTCHCPQSHIKCIQSASHTRTSWGTSESFQIYFGNCIPLEGRSRSLQWGQTQRKQLSTCSLWDLRSGDEPQDRKIPIAFQRGTWDGISRSQSC